MASGVSAGRIRTLVRRQVLVPVAHGLYGRGALVAVGADGRPSDRILRVAAALTLAGPEAVASHHDAAVIHGFNLLDDSPAEFVAVTRPPGVAASRTGRPGIRVHNASLLPSHVTTRHGIMVTSAARTVVDLARNTSFRSGVVTADSALHAKMTSKAELLNLIQACPRWPGIQRARDVVEFADARSESAFESIARVVFQEQGLPPPDLQVWVGEDGMVVGRVDFLWRKYRTIAEADGAIKYSDPDRARRQLQRDARLREAGFEVVHFTWKELHIAPGYVAAAIRAAFRRGAAS